MMMMMMMIWWYKTSNRSVRRRRRSPILTRLRASRASQLAAFSFQNICAGERSKPMNRSPNTRNAQNSAVVFLIKFTCWLSIYHTTWTGHWGRFYRRSLHRRISSLVHNRRFQKRFLKFVAIFFFWSFLLAIIHNQRHSLLHFQYNFFCLSRQMKVWTHSTVGATCTSFHPESRE